jgi:hypothetical protein
VASPTETDDVVEVVSVLRVVEVADTFEVVNVRFTTDLCLRFPTSLAGEVVAFESGREYSHRLPTPLTGFLGSFDAFPVWVSEEFVRFFDARRTVDAVLVRRVVFELVVASFAGRDRFRVSPVPVVLAGRRITVVTVVEFRIRIVETLSTSLAGSVRQ